VLAVQPIVPRTPATQLQQENATTRAPDIPPAVGVDGCPGGWLAVSADSNDVVHARVFASIVELVEVFASAAAIGIDIPMGLLEEGSRSCEREARQFLGMPRRTSVFPAPLRATLEASTYQDACEIRFRIEGKKMSRQAFGILKKVREVNAALATNRTLVKQLAEVHPEVSFALMNGGCAMRHGKKSTAGKGERRTLIESLWPGAIDRVRPGLRGQDCALDDLHDAFAALWSARRWASGEARIFGAVGERDSVGLPMRIVT
jgi:predicted RNase H-like nuclease